MTAPRAHFTGSPPDDPFELLAALASDGIAIRLQHRSRTEIEAVIPCRATDPLWEEWEPIVEDHIHPFLAILTGQVVRIDTPRPRPLCGAWKKRKRRTKPKKPRGPSGPAPRGAA